MPRPPRTLSHDGQTRTLKEWAASRGMSVETLRCRLDHLGWAAAEALSTPPERKFAGGGRPRADQPRPCPKLRQHAGTGRAYCRWESGGSKRVVYLGKWGSPAAAEAYRRFGAEWAAGRHDRPLPVGPGLTVGELILGYLGWVKAYYQKAGRPTSEVAAQLLAMKCLNTLFGTTPAADFGPNHLRACQADMVAKGWVRLSINRHVWRVTRCFRWGVGQSLVPPDVHARLKAVDGLKAGRSAAPDNPPVRSVPAADLDKVIPHLDADERRRAVLAEMVRFHLATGMRPGELCAMTAADLDRTGDAWLYTVTADINKNTHRDKRQRYWLGPKALAILSPFLADPGPGGRVWCFPARGAKGTKRTPVSRPRYAECVRRACIAAGVEPWHPHQLRHNRATEVQRRYESDAMAAAAIGDSVEVAREVYVDPGDAVRRRIALETG